MGIVQAGPNHAVSDNGDTGSPLPLSHSASLSALLPGSEAAPTDGGSPLEQQSPDQAAASSSSPQVCHPHKQTQKFAANITCASFGWQIACMVMKRNAEDDVTGVVTNACGCAGW